MRRWVERGWLLWVYLALDALLLTGMILAPDALTFVFRTAISVVAVAAIAVGVVCQRPAVPEGWWLLAAGTAATAGAATARAASLLSGSPPGPDVTLVQVLFLLSLILFVAGLARLVRLGGGASATDTLDAFLVALATFLVIYWLVIGSITAASGASLLARVVYPLGAIVLFTMAVLVALSVGIPTVSIGLLLVSMAARVGLILSLLVPAFTTGSLLGASYTPYLGAVAGILLGAAALHPSLAATRVRRERRQNVVAWPRVVLFVVMALVGLTALGARVMEGEEGNNPADVAVLLVGGSVLLLLIVTRLGVTAGIAQRSATELAQRTSDLASAVREQEALQRQLRHQAMHDPLTGLPNRVVLVERLEWVLTRPDHRQLTLAAIDLDRFGDIRDTYGHLVGDSILVKASHRLLDVTPGQGMLARLMGDKFAVLLEDTGLDEARQWAERARSTLCRPYRVGGQELFLEPRIGLLPVEPPRPAPTATQALRDADLALRAARSGGNRVAVFSPEQLTAQTYFNRLSNGLRRALARNELTLDYQPVVDLETGRVVATEALLRWNPPGAPATPSEFIPVAEQTGMIRPIGAWVLRAACRDARPWYEQHGVAVSVNVSASQLEEPGFDNLVEEVLRGSGLPGSALMLEITESNLIATASARDTSLRLERIRSLGVRIAIDDFGTGYSSLSYLSRLPVDIVKIDRSFVQQLDPGHGQRQWAFIRAILHLVESMGLQAVAEGVETSEQAVALRELRCPCAQGFLFAKPMPADALTRTLAVPVLPGARTEEGKPRAPRSGSTATGRRRAA